MKDFIEKEIQVQAALGLCLLRNGTEGKNSSRSKKTAIQSLTLKEVFRLTMYPSSQTKIDLSVLLNLEMKTINVWFQNERQSEKVSISEMRNCNKRSEKVELNPLILYKIYCDIKSMLA